MINKPIWFLLPFILLRPGPGLTQPLVDGYSIQHFTDDNGLPQNSINDLLFDRNGYLWLASQVGLIRFNGSTFQPYYPNDKPLMESNITSLGKDDRGTIYFETVDHHLYCVERNDSQSPSPIHTPSSRRPLLLNQRKQVYDFSAFLQKASSTAAARQREAIFRDLFDDPEDFFVTDQGHVYLTDRDSIYYYDGNDLHLLAQTPGSGCRFLAAGNRFYVLARDTVVGVYEDGKKIRGTTIIPGDVHHPFPAGLGRDDYKLFSSGGFNHLLTGNRLYRVAVEADGRLRADFLVDLDFIPNISSVEYDAGLDLLLISTSTEGFYFLRKNRFLVDGWSADLKNRLAHHLFGPMALQNNRVIITDKLIFTPGGSYTPVWSHGPIWQRCLYIDRTDHIWGAFDSLPEQLTAQMVPVRTLPALDANIMGYAEDLDGRLYCLTEQSLWQLGNDGFHRLYTLDRSADDRMGEVIACVGTHRIWIGHTNGLIEYNTETNGARAIPQLDSSHVRAIQRCKDGSWLIGTYGQGYFYYASQRFYKMPLDKNGFLITAHCFLEDKHGMIWIPCNKGLFKVPKRDIDAWASGESSRLYYYYYGRQDGLLTNEFNGGFNGCGVITPEGFVALLSMKGTVCFEADSLMTDFPSGAIDMTELDIDGKPARRTDTIGLTAGYKSLLVKVASPYLGNRNNLYLESSMSGLRDDWKAVPEDGLIDLSGLAPGAYTLKVRQVNGFGSNNYQYRQWTIVVPPLFYRTTWFWIAAALLVLILVGRLIQLRLKLREKKKEVKDTIVQLKETVTLLQHSEQALLKTNKQREKLISLVIHDLRSPLRFLTMLATDLHENQSDLNAVELKDRIYWVKKGAQDIYHFSEDFLLWVSSQKDNFKIAKQLFYMRPLLQEIHDFYLEQVVQKGNRISYETDEGLQLYSDPHLLITIIRNLTDNANKYTEQGAIHISATRQEDRVLIVVADTGRGMTPQQVEAFLGEENLDNVKSGSQLGHKFIFDLTKRLNGTLCVESKENMGTTVTLRLDCPSASCTYPE